MRTIAQKAQLTSWLVLVLVMLLSLLGGKVSGQSLQLQDAYDLLASNYAVLQNAGLNDQILMMELDILDLERRPSLYLNGSATLQSDATSLEGGENLPISLDLPLYNARAYGEVNYTINDGGRLEARKQLTAAEGKLGNQQLAVERFALRKRVNQLFLGVLLARERVDLFETTLKDLAERKAVVQDAVALGAALESELLQLQVREVEIEASQDDVNGQIDRLLANLSTLIGQRLAHDVVLEVPALPSKETIPNLQRPELQQFRLQREAIMANQELIEADTKPVLSAFLQAGLGAPNPVNLFDTGISPYAIGGVNFQWKLKDWGKSKKQRQLLALQAAKVQNQEATFRFNLDAENDAYLADVRRLETQIVRAEEVADLQAEILTQLGAQLDNGVITATDYLSQANAELLARQQLKIYETELQQLQLNFLNDRGGF